MVQNLVQLGHFSNHTRVGNLCGDLHLLYFLLGCPPWLRKHSKPESTLHISRKFEKSEIDLFREGWGSPQQKKRKICVIDRLVNRNALKATPPPFYILDHFENSIFWRSTTGESTIWGSNFDFGRSGWGWDFAKLNPGW